MILKNTIRDTMVMNRLRHIEAVIEGLDDPDEAARMRCLLLGVRAQRCAVLEMMSLIQHMDGELEERLAHLEAALALPTISLGGKPFTPYVGQPASAAWPTGSPC